eukprot:Gb_34733 [translate_table: standard]
METLVLLAQDQFARQHDKQNGRLAGVGFYYTNINSEEDRKATPAYIPVQPEMNCKTHLPIYGYMSNLENSSPQETSCSFSPASPKAPSSLKSGLLASPSNFPSFPSSLDFQEGCAAPPGRRWHSMPCSKSLEGESIVCPSQTQDHGVGVIPHYSQFRSIKHEKGRNSRSHVRCKNSCHATQNKEGNHKRSGFDWKPVEIGTQNVKAVPIPSPVRTPERSFIDAKDCSIFSPSTSVTENWAGPAYSNSPPPSSLPFPKFSMRQRRSVSLELPSASNAFIDAVSAVAVDLPGSSRSAPTSPSREAPVILQDFDSDVASATKDLRRMLNLDFNA